MVEVAPMADNRTMEELLQAPTEGFEETFGEARERFKEMLRACPHHKFMELTQIDTFYNGLNENDQDSLNAAAGGNLLSQTTREALHIIENKSKVRYSRNKPNVSRMNTASRENARKTNDRIDKLADQILILVEVVSKKVFTPATVKAVEECTYNQVAPLNHASNYMAPPSFAPRKMVKIGFLLNQALTSGTLPSNTIPNLKGEMKTITTRSGVAYEGPSISTPKKVVERETEETTDKEQANFQGSTAHIQPSVVPISEPDSLLANKDMLIELAKISLNENCSAMLLKKLPEKLGDPGKFLIPCDFSRMDACHTLADLADRSITRPKGVAEDVFVKVGKFHFPIDFVVIDFEADPRVPLILGRSFLRTGRALIDVYGEEITLWVNDEAVTFNLNQTKRYSSTHDDMSVNRMDVIDVAREEYAQEMLGFSKNSLDGNPTSTSERIISDYSPSLTLFEGSDFILKDI
uniref:DNA-directed DNA polymerase n=1 Tax=Tanacetum cinerariifolium TaxID=118510 RepID=A0A6L2NZ58_TANCI|nr:DNA-directed DNA polymerase [Tanacetum cinerariifolium]